ncbi:hypothetical protein [Amycolatopsis taiwanensis]|uniref:hypothetical protein n=1 Tax=Amycolatopsis taiwanensis TaxID=342230 RepID=UPI0004ACCD2F|nr:hypothetical protein [Amycolatopsis taiwanensis]
MGADEGRWGTFDCERTVLFVARTMTSAIRLLEAWDIFRGDFRVKVVFTVDDTSRFSTGVPALLRTAGVPEVLPWENLREASFDLAVSASENIDFSAVKSRTVVLPHGLGFNKYVPDVRGSGTRLAGLPPAEALRSGRVVVVLSHPEQEHQLRAACPEIAGHTAVTGDPTYDRLLASEGLRDRYRLRLGTGNRRLILLSSTWRAESQLGRWRTLPLQLLAELPADEYQVAAVLHPNIWAWYGEAQVRTWFADAVEAGLVLLPPDQGWQAALVAADQVVGDHGSMSLHAAALGKPLLLAAYGTEVVPGTPIDELGRTAGHLDPRHGLREQLDKAAATHDPRRFDGLTARVFAHVGDSTRRLRDLLYAELDLAPPRADPPLLRAADAEIELRPVTAFDVYTAFTDATTITMVRHPRAARRVAEAAPADEPVVRETVRHLIVDEEELDLRLTQNASVLTRRLTTDVDTTTAWTATMLRNFPGAIMAAAGVPGGCRALLRDGRRVDVAAGKTDAMVLASAIYAALLAERLTDGPLIVRLGAGEFPLSVTVTPPAGRPA